MAKLADLPLAQHAGILCNDEAFRRYVAARIDAPGAVMPSVAAAFLRRHCQIPSRRDLATNPAAAARFEALRTEFDAWRGRIPAQEPRP